MEHVGFPSIAQFRNVIRSVSDSYAFVGDDAEGNPIYDHSRPKPVLTVIGTVKLHGSCASIVKTPQGYQYQSRERILTLEEDNANFMRTFSALPAADLDNLFAQVSALVPGAVTAIFGEWCGQGIQRGAGIHKLPKMWVIFKILVDGKWLTQEQVLSVQSDNPLIRNIYTFQTYRVDIDFNQPQLQQNLLGALTIEVEGECPVAAALGEKGIGEGIVWAPLVYDIDDKFNHERYWFKVKGEKHSVTKVKTLAEVDVEKLQSQIELVDALVTENRLNQGLQVMRDRGLDIDVRNLGDFIRWIFGDCVKEELDRIEASGFQPKELGSPIAAKTKQWFFAYLRDNP